MASTKVNDLEIIIKAKNEAKKAFGDVKDDLTDIEQLTKIATGAAVALGAAGAAAFTALAEDGKETALQLREMGTLLGDGTQEAGALFSVLRDRNPKIEIDSLTDAVLTLKERFSEARVETGELFNFAKDFGLEYDANISGSANQTLEFLKILKQLPDAGDRVTTAIAVMGDEGARQFNPIIQDLDTINELIEDFEDGIGNAFSGQAAKDIDEYAESSARLAVSYENLGLAVFGLVDGNLSDVNNTLAAIADKATEVVNSGVIETLGEQLANAGKGYLSYITAGAVNLNDPVVSQPQFLDPSTQIPANLLESPELVNARAKAARDAEAARIKNEKAAEKSAEREAVRRAKVQEKIQRDAHKLIEEREAKFIQDAYDRRIALDEATSFAIEARRAAGLSDDPVDDGGFNQTNMALSDDERSVITNRLQELDEENEILNQTREDTLLVADAFGALEGAIGSFSDAFLTKGSRAFKLFIALQAAAATASAYSAAAQALADFSNLSAAGKIVAGFEVLGLGLSWASQIASLTSAANGAGSAAPPPANSTPNIPQAPDIPEQANGGGTLNVTVVSKTLKDFIDIEVVENIFELASEIPGGVGNIEFNQVLSG